MNKILLKGGHIIDPANKINEITNILIEDGKIKSVGLNLKANGAEIIDCNGKIIMPGLIDIHVHMREPGFEDKATIKSERNAAAAGGFTRVVCMPNTDPVIDCEPIVRFVKDRAQSSGTKVEVAGAITKGQKGKELAEIKTMLRAGIVGITEDGHSVENTQLLKNAMRYALMDNIVIMSHCEDHHLAGGGIMHEGKVSNMLGLKGIPSISEDIIVARDIMLAEDTGCKLHIQHVSSKGAIDLIKRAKKQGLKVTAETAPHYFVLTDEVVKDFNTNQKMNPPLRTEEDKLAIIKALADGTLDAIATDHAPHTIDDKDREYDLAPNGVIGLETSLAATYTELVLKDKISLSRMVELMSTKPAEIISCSGGTLSPGADADITVMDPDTEWVVDPAKFLSTSRNSPFIGTKLKSSVMLTIVDGEIVYRKAE